MKRFFTRKVTATVLVVGLVLGGGGVALAYFTSGGTGTGSATVGSTGPTDFAVTQSGPTGTMYPGAAAVPFTVRAQNTGTGDEHVDDITIAVASDPETGYALDTSGDPIDGCQASWFDVDSPVSVGDGGATLSPGDYSDPADSSIGLSESGTDEDACQGVTVGLVFGTTTGG